MKFTRPLVAAAAALASMSFVGGPAAAAPTAPRVTVGVNCMLAATRTDPVNVYWFGYTASSTQYVDAGRANAFLETDATTGKVLNATANRGQVTQFQPGTHLRSFAVRVAAGRRLQWGLDTSIVGAEPAGTSLSTVSVTGSTATSGTTSVTVPACAAGVARYSAVAQVSGTPSVTFASSRRVLTGGLLTASSVRFQLSGVVSTCTTGTALAPTLLWGYNILTGGNINAIAAASVVRTDTLYSTFQNVQFAIPFTRTSLDTLTITNPQAITINNYGQTFRGVATVNVIVDVTARCNVNGTTVTAAEPMWVDVTGLAMPFYMYTDSTQTTVPTPCVPLTIDQPGCPFKGGSSGGGGGTARR